MFEINLVPEVQEKKQDIKKTNNAVVTISMAAFIITMTMVFIILGLNVFTTTMINSTESNISSTKEEIAKYKELEETVTSLERGLLAAKEILSGQNSWTKLLPHLEAATPANVKFTELTMAIDRLKIGFSTPNIDGLAKFVNSYKNYQVVVFSGQGKWGEIVEIFIDGNSMGTANVGTDGNWVYATRFNPSINHEITIANGGDKTIIKYDSTTKKAVSNGDVQTKISNLFSKIDVAQYRKTDVIKTEAKLNFDGGLLW